MSAAVALLLDRAAQLPYEHPYRTGLLRSAQILSTTETEESR